MGVTWASIIAGLFSAHLKKRSNSGRRPQEPVSSMRGNSPIHCQEKRRPLTLLVELKSAYTEDGERSDGLRLTLRWWPKPEITKSKVVSSKNNGIYTVTTLAQ